MDKGTFIYEGKAKRLFETSDPNIVLIEYKDSFTAFNGEKKATIGGKGQLNNKISAHIFTYLRSVTLAELVRQQESRARGETVVMRDHRPPSPRSTEPVTA